MNMREAVPKDAALIRTIALATISEDDLNRLKAMERAYRQEEIVRAISSSEEAREQYFIVGEFEENVIGFCHAIDRGDMWEMLRLYLHPDYHRNGYGAAFLNYLQSKKEQPMEVYVENSNDQAIAFLLHQSFKEVNRVQEEVYDQPMELIHLRYHPS
ncbi:GNAT family N-acetyltransferase [Exiguobacterium sp. s160]|uniref:GNAT family N-acetyltransferase n=1 Tax=Exiguobacterium sp. s160 TaxID=2751265 RepID=UPI001BEAE3D8|nr:GNAT family N-acetyltransferase [Exiguobacterium sp. s160]